MKTPKFFKQEKSYSCMVACLRMVLEHYGVTENEDILREKSKPNFMEPIHLILSNVQDTTDLMHMSHL